MRRLWIAATLAVGMGFTALPVFADALPTVDQIYQAEEAGHFDQAQKMVSEVLKARPDSAKAHFVQSELFAKQGYLSQARSELGAAERLDPSDHFATARAMSELKSQLGAGQRTTTRAPQTVVTPAREGVHFPWGTILILALVVGVVMMLFRRRATYNQYPQGGPGATGSAGYGPTPGYGPGPGYGPAPGGMGSGIAGGLASGLAVGAGVVAGEELAHHFLDGGRRESSSGFIPSADAAQPDANSDMGGNDFGVNDPGSWDDGGGGGGGGDDWS
jgi:hypothetical protein